MKKNERKDLRSKKLEDLQSLVKKMEIEVGKLMMDLKTGKVKNHHLCMAKRHDLAFLKTLIWEKRQQIESVASSKN